MKKMSDYFSESLNKGFKNLDESSEKENSIKLKKFEKFKKDTYNPKEVAK